MIQKNVDRNNEHILSKITICIQIISVNGQQGCRNKQEGGVHSTNRQRRLCVSRNERHQTRLASYACPSTQKQNLFCFFQHLPSYLYFTLTIAHTISQFKFLETVQLSQCFRLTHYFILVWHFCLSVHLWYSGWSWCGITYGLKGQLLHLVAVAWSLIQIPVLALVVVESLDTFELFKADNSNTTKV